MLNRSVKTFYVWSCMHATRTNMGQEWRRLNKKELQSSPPPRGSTTAAFSISKWFIVQPWCLRIHRYSDHLVDPIYELGQVRTLEAEPMCFKCPQTQIWQPQQWTQWNYFNREERKSFKKTFRSCKLVCRPTHCPVSIMAGVEIFICLLSHDIHRQALFLFCFFKL